jgi:hypothetical protein
MSTDKYFDAVCNKHFSTQSALNKHLKGTSHLKQIKINEQKETGSEIDEKELKKAVIKRFYCPLCDFETKITEHFGNHIDTERHKENQGLYKENIKDKVLYKTFINDLEDGNIFLGVFKGKDYNKKEIDEKYKIKDDKYNLSYNERVKYGENKNSDEEERKRKEKDLKIKDLQYSIDLIEKKQKEYEKQKKKYDKYISSGDISNKEVMINPDSRREFQIHLKKAYPQLEELKKELNKLKD